MGKKLSALLILLLILAAGWFFLDPKTLAVQYSRTKQAFPNPVMGYAPWFRGLEALPEDASMVYVQILWKDLEPEEGVYDWQALEEKYQLPTLRRLGFHLVLRFICDYPGSKPHRDIPQWLYEKTGDGMNYDISYGKGYCPNYANPFLLQAHERAVSALGEYFGKDGFVSFVELGSLGHWGEWHIKSGLPPIPSEEIRALYVAPWVAAFPNAQLLMRRPFTHAEQYGLGLYNDMTGNEKDTMQWLQWIQSGGSYAGEAAGLVPMPEGWKTSAMGGEVSSSASMEEILSVQFSRTLSLLRQSHTTFIGPKIPDASYPEARETILGTIGYRIGITEAVLTRAMGRNTLILTWENTGIAPLYWDWPVRLYVLDVETGIETAYPVELNLSQLLPGSAQKSRTVLSDFSLIRKLETGMAQIALGIQDPMRGKDAIRLTTDAPWENNRTVLFAKSTSKQP